MTSQWVAVALTLFVCRLSGAQYFTTGRASRFFDVDDSDATVEKPRRLANDSLLVIAQLPSAYVTAFTSVSQRPFSGDDAEAINHLNRHWGTIAMPPFTPFNPQQPYNGGTYASPIVAATATYCPATCTPCSYAQCHDYQVHCEPSVINCCCPSVAASLYDLKDSCDGEEAVAACINGLCGQGYMCTAQRFCCRCASGRSISSCVNGTCPQGFVCNDNNYCCSIDGVSFSTVSGQCVNGRCPVGFICEADNYCHAATPFAGSNNINVSFFTPGVGPVILGKCVNDRCPVGYTCGVGNLCYSNAKIDGHFPTTPYVLGRCERGICPLGYTCGIDDFCYSNILPVARIGRRPEVLGRCESGLCPTGYSCSSDDFCHRQPEARSRWNPSRHDADEKEDNDDNSSGGNVSGADDDKDRGDDSAKNINEAVETRRHRADKLLTHKKRRSTSNSTQRQGTHGGDLKQTRRRSRYNTMQQMRRHKLTRTNDYDENDIDFLRMNKVDNYSLNDEKPPGNIDALAAPVVSIDKIVQQPSQPQSFTRVIPLVT